MIIEFDDIIYYLQKSGGASVYWKEITSRIEAIPGCSVIKTKCSKISRGIPVISKADVFHSSHFRYSIFSKSKNVTTAYDLIYEKGLIADSAGSKLNALERRLSYFSSDAIICISENTKKDLLDIYPALKVRCPLYVIFLGINLDSISNAFDAETRIVECPYMLYVGGRAGYKNFIGALEGYYLSGVWRDGVKLICTGSKFVDSELELFKKMGLGKMIVCEEHVETKRLYELYRSAYCLLYTSLYEGFGLPLIEAMSCGCPVIASNISSIQEVAGNAAILINPYNYADISNSIMQLQCADMRDEIISKGITHAQQYSWDKSVIAHYNVYKEIIGL